MKFKEIFITEKSELEKLIPLVKKSHKEIKDVKLIELDNKFGKGEYIEVTFKNSEYRAEVVTFMKDNLGANSDLNYDYDGTALLIAKGK